MFQASEITIVGTGLLGGSIGLGLRAAGWSGRITGVGRRAETVQRALAAGCVDTAATDLCAAARQSELVILATPISAFPAALMQLAGCDASGLVITDVGSTKGHVCELVWRALPGPKAQRFVGSHPMAGAEARGPDAARADLFRGRPCILTPQPDTDPAALALVEGLWRLLGMRLVRMSPAEHDRTVARVSHLPHAVAALLVRLAVREGGLDVASTGLRDTTRVASGDPDLWVDIFTTNRQAVLEAMAGLERGLGEFRQVLERGDHEALRRLLDASKQERDRWLARGAPGSGE